MTQTVSRIVFESERLYHGTPSGIDNTVIAYGKPLWFVKGEEPALFMAEKPFTLTIADSGIFAPTKETVGDVRRGWQADSQRYEGWFDAIGEIVTRARAAIRTGDLRDLGLLFDPQSDRIGAAWCQLHLRWNDCSMRRVTTARWVQN